MKKTKELTIKEEQAIQLQVLHIFDKACTSEGLQYYMAYGTLLGAVREKGFIEWDDDIDIWMLREDYEEFQEVFSQYFSEGQYFLQTYKTDPKTVSPEMMRICVAGTYKWPEGCEKEKFNTSLYFDIFPLDYGFGTEYDKEALEKSSYYHGMLLHTLRKKGGDTLKGKLRAIIGWLIPRRWYTRKITQLIGHHRACKSTILLSFPASYAGLKRSYFDSAFFEKVTHIPFEDMQVPVPARYDELLRYMYGDDYMIPAVTKPHRVCAYFVED